jgi:hypothetical protein
MTPTEQLIREAAEKNPFRYLPCRMAYAEALAKASLVANNPGDFIAEAVADAQHDYALLRDLVQRATAQAPANEDTELLDWCEKHGHEIHITCWKGAGAMQNPWTIHLGDFLETEAVGEADTLRAAICAAMKGGKA